MELLDKIYFGNSLQSWLVAVGILVVAFALFKIVLKVLINRISALATTTATQVDDLLVAMLKRTKNFILFASSLYLASNAVILKPATSAFWLKACVVLLILQAGIWINSGFSFWLQETVRKRQEEDAASITTITLLGVIARVSLWTVILLLLLGNLGVNITGLVAGLGIGGIAVALAVQNILGDLLASLSIVLDKPFVIGDFIVVDSHMGTIEHIGLKTTRIRSLSGEQLIFSNNDLLSSRVRNYKRMSERRIVFGFGVVYQTSLAKLKAIKEIVTDIITKVAEARLDRVHFKDYGDSSLNFEVVYYVTDPDYTIYMNIQEIINQEIFRRFAEEEIDFAYPTQTLFIQKGDEGGHHDKK